MPLSSHSLGLQEEFPHAHIERYVLYCIGNQGFCVFRVGGKSLFSFSLILQDLHALEARLRAYERKYGVTSADFYELYQEGLLDDEGFEQSTEFARWASAYMLKLKREAVFQSASRQFVETMKKADSAGFCGLPSSRRDG